MNLHQAFDKIANLKAQNNALKDEAAAMKLFIKRQLVFLDDVKHNMLSECDCGAFQEPDTGTWIHDEQGCATFLHRDLEQVIEAFERMVKER